MYDQFEKANIGKPSVIKETFSSMLADMSLYLKSSSYQ